MKFLNSDIDISTLPKAETVKLIPIDGRYYTVLIYYQVVYFTIYFIAMLITMILNSEFHSFFVAGLTVALFTLICYLSFKLIYLNFKNKAYAIREHDIIYQTGWWRKSLHVCPFNRIQHCSIDAGVFERNLGISKLKIYSAGMSNSDIAIPGLTLEDANNLRELIIQKIKQETV